WGTTRRSLARLSDQSVERFTASERSDPTRSAQRPKPAAPCNSGRLRCPRSTVRAVVLRWVSAGNCLHLPEPQWLSLAESGRRERLQPTTAHDALSRIDY